MFFDVIPPPEIIRYEDDSLRLIMRRPQRADVVELVAGIQASLPALKAFMPWAHLERGLTVDAQSKRIETAIEHWDQRSDFLFHLYIPQGDDDLSFAGCMGLHPRCLSPQGFEIGFWVRSDIAGRGLCTLASKMLVLAGAQVMGLRRIQVGCDRKNIASRRVIEKVGFHHEGLLRNMAHSKVPDDVRDGGWQGSGDIEIFSLIPADLDGLSWIDSVSKHLHFETLDDR
jgi:RimJ/RimL family protein N-acetyltransferase